MKAIVALAGGVGAARFLEGLARLLPRHRTFIIGNTGDDVEMHGLHISPDLDTVTYTLAGVGDRKRGWGLQGDTFHCLAALGRFGLETWFQLSDGDFATHLYRTERLAQGVPLSGVTAEIAAAFGLRARLTPMSDQPVRTRILTRRGDLEFQTWFVKHRARDPVIGVRYAGAAEAVPAPGVLEAIGRARAILVCPSNPLISIGPILAVPGIREALRTTRAPVLAISPIVGGQALKGPAARMMKSMGMASSALQVARLYEDFLDIFVLDHADRSLAPAVEALGLRAVVTNTIMTGLRRKKALASAVLEVL
jgi:LPPG:FO 2-phospho-L-lactate transferase